MSLKLLMALTAWANAATLQPAVSPGPKPAASPKPSAAPVKANEAAPEKTASKTPAVSPKPMTAEVKALVERVQAFYEKTQDFTADFRQDYTYKAFKRTQTSTGKVIYKKPALMRWDYEKPSARTFVLAADKVYALDPEAKTLTKMSIAANQLSASVTFLWGQGKLSDEFAIAQKECASCTGTLLELTPLKADPRFQKVLLEVDPKTAQVRKSTVIDPDGSENAITFSSLVANQGIDEKAFKLTPPPGTHVTDYTQSGAPPPTALSDAGRP